MHLCIDSPSTDVYFNLAAEEYLLKETTADVFMLWQSVPAVVIGKHQCLEAEADMDFASRQGICLARRFTGGGAVYHDLGNLNLSFIQTVSRPADFRAYLQQTVDYLSTWGLEAQEDERMGIYIGGRKVSGSAQCVHRNRILYHCTLLYDTRLDVLERVLIGGRESGRGVPSVRSEVANIRSFLMPPFPVEAFRRHLFSYFSAGRTSYAFTEKDLADIQRIREAKYARAEWNLRLKNTSL